MLGQEIALLLLFHLIGTLILLLYPSISHIPVKFALEGGGARRLLPHPSHSILHLDEPLKHFKDFRALD